jgi:hypothetical protein
MTLSFVVTSSPLGFVLRRNIMLLVETRAQSDADDLARARKTPKPVKASRGTWLLREISEPRREAA